MQLCKLCIRVLMTTTVNFLTSVFFYHVNSTGLGILLFGDSHIV